jgi:hypothetical protein
VSANLTAAIRLLMQQIDESNEENARLRRVLRTLSYAAQTTGGTAGRDEGLCLAIQEAQQVLAGQQVNDVVDNAIAKDPQ